MLHAETSAATTFFSRPLGHQGSTAAAGNKNPEGNGASGHRVQHLSAVVLSLRWAVQPASAKEGRLWRKKRGSGCRNATGWRDDRAAEPAPAALSYARRV